MPSAQRHKNAYGEHLSQLPIVEAHRPRADAPRREMVGRRKAQDEQRLRRAQVVSHLSLSLLSASLCYVI